MLIKKCVCVFGGGGWGAHLKALCASITRDIRVFPILQIIQNKEAFRNITRQNQKKGEESIYRQFCCIIRKAGATLRSVTAPGFLPSFPSPRFI